MINPLNYMEVWNFGYSSLYFTEAGAVYEHHTKSLWIVKDYRAVWKLHTRPINFTVFGPLDLKMGGLSQP